MRSVPVVLVVLATVVSAMVLYGVYRMNPETGGGGFLPPCYFKVITGYDCPGCGGTRSVHCLMHGDVVEAFRFNPLFVAGAPLFLVVFGMARWWRGAVSRKVHFALWGSALAMVLVFWLVRNLAVFPWRLP